MKEYKGNSNRIVRVFNDELHEQLDVVADMVNMPYQQVFDIWCDLTMLEGVAPSLETLYNTCGWVIKKSS